MFLITQTFTWAFCLFSQSILTEINPEYSSEGLMLKLKLQYFGHLMCRANSLEKTLMLGQFKAGEGADSGQEVVWMASLTQWTWVWANSGRWWRTGKTSVLQSMGLQRAGHDWVTEEQQIILFIKPLYVQLSVECFIWILMFNYNIFSCCRISIWLFKTEVGFFNCETLSYMIYFIEKSSQLF